MEVVSIDYSSQYFFISEAMKSQYLTPLQLRGFNSSGILYGCMAGIDAWKDAGFSIHTETLVDYDTIAIFRF